MFCKKCGAQQDLDAIFCTKCGTNLKEAELNQKELNQAELSQEELSQAGSQLENATTNEPTEPTEPTKPTEIKEIIETTETVVDDVVETATVEKVEKVEKVENTETVAEETISKDVVAEVQQEIEAEINNLNVQQQPIEKLNQELNQELNQVDTNVQTEKVEKIELSKPENSTQENSTTQNVEINQEPEKKSNAIKILVIILAVLGGILVVGVIVVVAMFFMKPSLGRAALETQNQITKELEAAKASNPVAADLNKINDGESFVIDYYMDELLEANYLLYGDAQDIVLSADYDNTTGLFEYYLTGKVSNEEFKIDIMKMTVTNYRETYLAAVEENNKQLLADATKLFSSAAMTKGTKLKDSKYDYEYKFEVDAYELANILEDYTIKQNELQSQLLAELNIELQKLDPVEAGKLYTVLTGEPTNYYIDYMVEEYNTEIDYYNMYIEESIEETITLYEEDMLYAQSELDNVTPGDHFDVVVRTQEGKITFVEFSDDYDTIIIEADDFTSYLQSTYKIYGKGETMSTTDPLKLKLDITDENWGVEFGTDYGTILFDWDLVATENNISVGYKDMYTNDKISGTISGDYETGITLDMKDFGKLVITPKGE